MSAKRKHPSPNTTHEATIRTPVAELTGEETLVHYNTILLEEVRSMMKFVLEALESLRSEFHATLEASRREINQRLDVHEAVLRKHSDDIRGIKDDIRGIKADIEDIKIDIEGIKEDIQGHSNDIRGLKDDIQDMRSHMRGMETRLSEKIDRHGIILVDHEARIGSLEA